MKTKYLLILFIVPLLLVTSCKRLEDPVFDENASARMTAAVEEAYAVLQGNKAGWLMKYYPSRTREFGGYTIFAKFISNAEVMLTSDVDRDIVTSTYAVVPELSATLTFNGYNKIIHWFTEPGADNGGIGATDTGMKGDFEFVVIEANAERVILKGKKSGNEIVMLALQNNEFEELANDYQQANDQFWYFRRFALETSSGEVQPLNRYRRTLGYTSGGVSNFLTFRLTPGGIECYNEMEFGGVRFSKMKYVEPTLAYPMGYYTEASNSIKLLVQKLELNNWFADNLWSTSYNNTGATGRAYWDVAKTNLTSNGVLLNYFYFGKYREITGGLYVMQNGGVIGMVTHRITPRQNTTDQIATALAGNVVNIGGGFNANYWGAGLNYLTAPFNGPVFKITAYDPTSPTPTEVLLTDVNVPTNQFRMTLEPIADPLNN